VGGEVLYFEPYAFNPTTFHRANESVDLPLFLLTQLALVILSISLDNQTNWLS
jgi:hypothetical protein